MKEMLARYWRHITLVLVAVAVAIIGLISGGMLDSSSAKTNVALQSPPIYPTDTPIVARPVREIKVYVTGAVRVPGVYTMKDTDRVGDVIHVAGDVAVGKDGVPLADLSGLNLAEQLQDGQRVDVPFKALPSPTIMPTATLTDSCAIPTAVAVPNSIKVYVTGAVCRAGVYSLAANARVSDALTAAGGARADADVAAINLAGYVADGQQIDVPVKGQAPVEVQEGGSAAAAVPFQATATATVRPSSSAGSTSSSGGSKVSGSTSSSAKPVLRGKLNINTASAAELDQYLPGVGPSIAGRIVDYRKQHGGFKRIEDLMKVKGIGPVTFQKLKDLITV